MASDSTIMKDKFPMLKTYAEAKLEVEKLYPDNNSVKTMLPTAAAWDATCAWLKRNEEISEVGEKELYIDAKVWGNHREELFADYDAKQERTGYGLNANKIYDLTGNEQEWTTETGENNYNIVRGGTFRSDIIITFYLKREASDETAKAGCRPIMYIK